MSRVFLIVKVNKSSIIIMLCVRLINIEFYTDFIAVVFVPLFLKQTYVAGLSDLPEDVLQRQAAMFLGDLKEFCNTTQKAVDGVVQGVDGLIQLYNNYLKVRATV